MIYFHNVNTGDPLFILGAVAIGMFGSPKVGVALAIAHYLSSFTVGVLFRFYKKGDMPTPELGRAANANIIRRAARELIKARREDGRPFGKLMADATKESILTLLMICGYIMLFSVVVKVASLIKFTAVLSPLIAVVLRVLHIDPSLTDATFRGLLEIDLGCVASAKAVAPLLDKVVIASFIIAWSGLSVHAQVASVIAGSDIRMGPYMLARLAHGAFAGLYTWMIMVPFAALTGWSNTPVFEQITHGIALGPVQFSKLVVEKWFYGGVGLCTLTGCLIGASCIAVSADRIRVFMKRALR